MSEPFLLPADTPPKSGEFVEPCDDILPNPTEEELEEGKRLGEEIDTDDDEDTGL